ncbi:MAG: ABC transporter ATP-binding protein [Acidimicrobiia bacterium]
MSTPAVRLDGVEKRFGDVIAVDRVDLVIEDGEFFSLLGPSGCGKTTTLRMIAGLEFPTAGALEIFGEDMGLRPPNKRPVNTVFQSYALFPHRTVARNIAFGLEMQKVPRSEVDERVARAIELVRLDGMEGRRPDQLSGGQQQRVALARALVNEPKVLLLDEPLGALDLKLRQAMQFELKELQERVGITFIYVTHDQEEALTMSDRIGVMHDGRLLQVGTPEEIYEHPSTRFVADFIGETNFLGATSDGSERVILEGGTAIAVVGAPAGAGRTVTVAIRPEKIGLHTAGEEPETGFNALPGRVRRRVYQGDAITYEVDCDSGVHLRVRHPNLPGVSTHGEGADVVVSWPVAATQVLEA